MLKIPVMPFVMPFIHAYEQVNPEKFQLCKYITYSIRHLQGTRIAHSGNSITLEGADLQPKIIEPCKFIKDVLILLLGACIDRRIVCVARRSADDPCIHKSDERGFEETGDPLRRLWADSIAIDKYKLVLPYRTRYRGVHETLGKGECLAGR